ncbi:sensor histidine kinase [Hylemonella gracilis]|jgi:signal transduction histidine kinase|uniref:histidine kinase n=1 Tax=Hylemonella gracilis TaxID=80880 RepID=A0A4P6UR14_9BURK|nr:ATP-binding protein [Hylemonella gracilis]QBK06191.1 sensor histidine kinase [Hylemonella gracilis]
MTTVTPQRTELLRAAWARLTEPTVVRRTLVSVLLAFVLVWAVLLAYIFITYKQTITNEPSMKKFGDALLMSLQDIADPTHAAAVMASTDKWTNIRRRQIGLAPGSWLYELNDASGQPIFISPDLRALTLPPFALESVGVITEARTVGTMYRIYTGDSARWHLRVIEPKRTDAAFLAYNARFILPYLLLSAPFVLLSVWLSVRNGLWPLQQLAARIAERSTDDLKPVGFDARHRELKPLEQSLDHLFNQLRIKVERERSFVQDAAHEIRTPLAVITAQAHVMARANSESERTQAQAHLEQAIERASHLAHQLLDLAAFDEAQRPVPREIDVAHWLRAALAQAVPRAMEKRIELSLDAPETLLARLDLMALESIVHNLVDNAVRYAGGAEGRKKLRGSAVAVALRIDGDRLHLTVRDDGPGIALIDQPRVFERFHRGSGSTERGSGLGLAIVLQAARSLGGEVRLGEGLEGRGVGFYVNFPLHD